VAAHLYVNQKRRPIVPRSHTLTSMHSHYTATHPSCVSLECYPTTLIVALCSELNTTASTLGIPNSLEMRIMGVSVW
jgi:hypothetical protein